MSGEFRPEQQTTIEATDNEALAKAHGLTQYDEATGQWRRPTPPDAGERDSGQLAEALRENARLSDELAERDAEIDRLKAELAERQGEGGTGETPPGFTPADQTGQATGDQQAAAPRKATGRK
jgi:hypothetical protein